MSSYNQDSNNNFIQPVPDDRRRVYDRRSYYKPRGRSIKIPPESNHVDPDPRWNNIYAHKDRKELYEIIHRGFKK